MEYDEELEELEEDGEQSFVCEDCDYKWDEEEDSNSIGFSVCPMCGSGNTLDITQ